MNVIVIQLLRACRVIKTALANCAANLSDCPKSFDHDLLSDWII